MGVVFEAFDRLEGRPVALKQVKVTRTAGSTWSSGLLEGARSPTSDSSQTLALAGEFATLASLRHPHIVEVRDYGFDADGQPFFTMELLEGAVPIERYARNHPDSAPELLAQLLEALRYLHRHGVLHRDLKPQNALVRPGPSLCLLDFGLAVLRESAQYAVAAGTPAYVAPEVATGSRPTAASDLYGFGVIAWDLLAGTHPYAADSTRETLESARDPAWRRDPPEAPAAIQELLLELVALHPSSRPDSVDEVLERWRRGFGLAGANEAIRRSFLQGARFVARQRELELLTGAMGDAARGSGSCWLVEADSGAGKSRLIDELCIRARVRGITVLVGQASDARLIPFDLWREVVPGLALLAGLEPLEAQVLGTLAPQLGQVLDVELEPPPELSAAAALTRLLSVVESVFDRIGPPALVVLEDLHWARPESLALLERLARGIATRPLLIVATARSGTRALDGVRRLPLGPLSRQEIADLAEAVLGGSGRDATLVRALEQISAGSPFWAIEAVRACAGADVDSVDPSRLEGVVDPQALVSERIASLDDDLALLELAATLGRRIDPELIEAGDPWLERMADEAVIDVQRGDWQFAHDAVRQAVLGQISASRRRQLHARAAALLTEHRAPAAAVAGHLSEAGQLDLAVPMHLQAAEEALALGAAAEAEKFATWVLEAARGVALTALQHARAERCALEASYAAGELPTALDRTEQLTVALTGTGVRRSLFRIWSLIALLLFPRIRDSREVWEVRLAAAESGFEAAQWAGRRDLALDLLLLGYRAARTHRLTGKLAAYHSGAALVLAATPLRGWCDTLLGWSSAYLDRAGPREEMLNLAGRALIAAQLGDWDTASDGFTRIFEISDGIGDRLHGALSLRYLWLFEALRDRPDRATELDEQLALYARHDDNPRIAGGAHLTHGFEALNHGYFPRAIRELETALELIEPIREGSTVTTLRGGLAWATFASGDEAVGLDLARQHASTLIAKRPAGLGGLNGHLGGFLVLKHGSDGDLELAIRAAEHLEKAFPVTGVLVDLLKGQPLRADIGVPLIADLAAGRRVDSPHRRGWDRGFD